MLIEHFAAMAVMVLLQTLVISSLRGARNQAREVMCRLDLRQTGSVLFKHVDGNESRLL